MLFSQFGWSGVLQRIQIVIEYLMKFGKIVIGSRALNIDYK
jgi:hypothetical protein